jgi:hypothetical protein
MAPETELRPHHYLRRRRPVRHRTPASSYTSLEIVTTLDARPPGTPPAHEKDIRREDWRLGLATMAIGEGYAPNYAPYRERVRKLKKQRKRMSAEEYAGFVNLVAEQMAEDRYARSGQAITICEFANNGNGNHSNLAVTGRLICGDELEIYDLLNPVVAGEEVQLSDIIPKEAVICELGRITVVEEYRGTREDGSNQTTELISHFIDGPNGVLDTARRVGATTLVTIAKGQFAKHTGDTGLPLDDPYKYNLQPRGIAVAQTYEGYWHDREDPPHVYIKEVPPKVAA